MEELANVKLHRGMLALLRRLYVYPELPRWGNNPCPSQYCLIVVTDNDIDKYLYAHFMNKHKFT